MLKQNFQFEFQNGPNVIHFKEGGGVFECVTKKNCEMPLEKISCPWKFKKKYPHPGTKFWRAGSHPVNTIANTNWNMHRNSPAYNHQRKEILLPFVIFVCQIFLFHLVDEVTFYGQLENKKTS